MTIPHNLFFSHIPSPDHNAYTTYKQHNIIFKKASNLYGNVHVKVLMSVWHKKCAFKQIKHWQKSKFTHICVFVNQTENCGGKD